jgi:hypothetical protein
MGDELCRLTISRVTCYFSGMDSNRLSLAEYLNPRNEKSENEATDGSSAVTKPPQIV